MLRDLVRLEDAALKLKIEISELLFEALEGKLQLVALSKVERSVGLVPCKKEWVEEEQFFIDLYDQEDRLLVDVEVAQPLHLNNSAIKELIVNGQFSEVELFRNLGPDLSDSEFEYWRTSEELYDHRDWVDGKPNYSQIALDEVHAVGSELKQNNKKVHSNAETLETPSNTSLKVVGLLMHYLAKTKGYASGTSPNKSQIKELLLQLAAELDVDNYGLNKVDERLLSEALKYLETQKN